VIPGITPIIEYPPLFGMNSVDDLKDLQPGECIELVNARPGNPPEIRKGCDVFLLEGSTGLTLIPPAIPHVSIEGTQHIVCWTQSGTEYKLVKINVDASPAVLTVVGTAVGFSNPFFSFVRMHNELYCFIDEIETTWAGQSTAVGSKIFSMYDNYNYLRPVVISGYPTITVHAQVTGTTYGAAENGKYVTYTASYIRRTDADAFTEAGIPKLMATALPGAAESIGSVSSIVTEQITGVGRAIVLSASPTTAALSALLETALVEGATHIRIFKSFAQATADDSVAAAKYFVVDLPINVRVIRADITGLTTTATDLSVTTATSHGFVNGDLVGFSGVVGTTEVNALDTEYEVAVTDADEFSLEDTDTEAFTPYTSGGYVGVVKDIEDIQGPSGVATSGVIGSNAPTSGPVIIKITGHGLNTGDQVLIKGSGGPFTAVEGAIY
jgi:hypothetical protein